MSSSCFSLPPSHPEDHAWKSLHFKEIQDRTLTNSSSPWGRLIGTWHEKKDGHVLSHRYAFCVDLFEGGIYIDCSKSKIFKKCAAQLAIRPFHIIIKTIYHISMIAIFCSIAQTFLHQQTIYKCLENSFKSIADIVRTPLYGVIIMITSIAVLALSVCDPDALYTGRMLIGKIEQKANWDEIHTPWTFAPCFQSFSFRTLDYYSMKFHHDTLYPDNSLLDVALSNFARSLIHTRRNKFLFAECCQKFPKDITYISPCLTADAAAGLSAI